MVTFIMQGSEERKYYSEKKLYCSQREAIIMCYPIPNEISFSIDLKGKRFKSLCSVYHPSKASIHPLLA